MNGMATQAQDSELQHSFGPQEIGFDYLPLELTPPDGTAVRTQPEAKLPYIDLNSNTPFELPETPSESPSTGSPPRQTFEAAIELPFYFGAGRRVDDASPRVWLGLHGDEPPPAAIASYSSLFRCVWLGLTPAFALQA